MIVDNQIFDERMLEDINNILNIGEVPNLFPFEDAEMIQEEIMSGLIKKKIKGKFEPDDLWEIFVSNCKKNLHLALCMTPIGDQFRLRLRNFPSLTNCTSILWVLPWGEEALSSVANHFLSDSKFGLDDSEKEKICSLFQRMHKDVESLCVQYRLEEKKYSYVTSMSYMNLMNNFQKHLQE